MNKKNKLFGLLAVIGCAALTAGFGLQVTANAEEKKLGGVDVSSFRMAYGAGVRFNPNATEEKTGIRFIANLSDSAYESLQALDGDVTYGMVIVPADIVKNNPLTLENLFGVNSAVATYCFEDPKEEGEEEGCTCTKQHIASVQYTSLAEGEKGDGLKDLRGSLVDIKEDNFTREFIGMAYMEYNGTYVLADNAYGENDKISDVKNNTRSMAYVAQLAIEDNQDDSENTLYNTYLKDLAETYEFAYTVNHYLPDENGEYGDPVTETAWGTLNEEVDAKHILNSEVEDADSYKAYKLYEIDSTQGNSTSLVYANGKTVLNAYYVPMDTTFPIVVNNSDWYLMGAQKNLTGATTTWHDSVTLNNVTKENVVQITTTVADEYTAGKFRIALSGKGYEKAKANDFSYIKLHMYIDCDNTVNTFNFLSKNTTVASGIATRQWVDVIIPLAKLNQANTELTLNGDYTKANFETYNAFGKYGYDGGNNDFLKTNSIQTDISTITDYNVTYYIDEVSWGIDINAPEITVSGLASEMFEGTFTEPTVSVTDDMALQSRLDSTVVKTLYKIDGETRTEVTLTDGTADLTKGSYVYVVTADDRIYDDVVGNVATEEVEFEVVERQDVVITFDSSEDVSYFAPKADKVGSYNFTTEYLDATALESEGLNSGDVTPVGGAIKISTGAEGSNNWGAWLKLLLGTDEIASVSDATKITFRMYMQIGTYTSWPNTSIDYEIDILDGGTRGTHIAGCNRNVWMDVTVDVASLAESYTSYLDGTNVLFWLGSTTLGSGSSVTYYINSITFDVTP